VIREIHADFRGSYGSPGSPRGTAPGYGREPQTGGTAATFERTEWNLNPKVLAASGKTGNATETSGNDVAIEAIGAQVETDRGVGISCTTRRTWRFLRVLHTTYAACAFHSHMSALASRGVARLLTHLVIFLVSGGWAA
jgi:hypothetical protein